jgi:hypothetical protein
MIKPASGFKMFCANDHVFLAVTGKFFANIQKSQQQDKHEPDSKGI